MFNKIKEVVNSIFILSIIIPSFCYAELNDLAKAFYHKGLFEDKVVFYFKTAPKIKLISSENCQETYHFLNTKISSPEAKQMIDKLNNSKHPFYKFNISQKGNDIEIKFCSDKKHVRKIEPFIFDAISLFKGLTFNISHTNARNYFRSDSDSNLNNLKPSIVIDIGHGGMDSGANGVKSLVEKDVVFKIGMMLKDLLKNDYNIFLTRDSDTFIPLDERTTYANFLPVKTIFISLHANFSKNSKACGLTTYYADYSLLTKLNFKGTDLVLGTGLFKELSSDNKLLANTVHKTIYKDAKEINPKLYDRGAQKSISQVLFGTEMPSILLELCFISNVNDADFIIKNSNEIAQAIKKGIDSYFNLYL